VTIKFSPISLISLLSEPILCLCYIEEEPHKNHKSNFFDLTLYETFLAK